MNKTERIKLEKALSIYFKEIHKIYTGGDFREESFYPALKRFIESRGVQLNVPMGTNVLVLPKKRTREFS